MIATPLFPVITVLTNVGLMVNLLVMDDPVKLLMMIH
jgi:hypothetical protein